MGRRRMEGDRRKRSVKWMKVGWLLLAVLGGAAYAGAQQLPDAPAPAAGPAGSHSLRRRDSGCGGEISIGTTGTERRRRCGSGSTRRRGGGCRARWIRRLFQRGLVLWRVADDRRGGWECVSAADSNRRSEEANEGVRVGVAEREFKYVAQSKCSEIDDIYSNRVELEQVVLYVERMPDSVQRDHIDWGFHLRRCSERTIVDDGHKGYFSNQLLDHDRQYGFDPVLEYVDVYFPHVAQGMNLRVGRFISVPGIEAQLTPNNYMFSHSLLYSVDPFTDTGAIATVQLNNQWMVQGRSRRAMMLRSGRRMRSRRLRGAWTIRPRA